MKLKLNQETLRNFFGASTPKTMNVLCVPSNFPFDPPKR